MENNENLTPEQALCGEVLGQFRALQAARKNIERGWELNIRFFNGEQYCRLSESGEIEENGRNFGWEQRRVFNHIAAVVDTRVSKLSRIRPALSVRAASDGIEDRGAAALSSAILAAVQNDGALDDAAAEATMWSELCGTAFYKVMWNSSGGRQVGFTEDGRKVSEGCAEVAAVSPFEIYPFSLGEEKITNQPGLIHARALPVQTIFDTYGLRLAGRPASAFGEVAHIGREKAAEDDGTGYELVIERYLPCGADLPDGRLTIVAGDKLVFDGPLPYVNGENKREYPFVKQVSLHAAGRFFGESVVTRLIPVQRAYNAVKNRKHEFLNRISMGCVAVEDGSIDVDDLSEDGLAPGKVIVYRQGGKPPEMLTLGGVPEEFWKEEDSLLDEFTKISGTGELTQNADSFSGITSATGLQLIIEQDDARLNVAYQSLKRAIKEVGRQVLRLYRQLYADERLIRFDPSDGGYIKYFKSSDVSGDDVVLDSDADLNMTPAQRRAVMFELIDRGLFSDESGKIGLSAKKKILAFLGYSSFADIMPSESGEVKDE